MATVQLKASQSPAPGIRQFVTIDVPVLGGRLTVSGADVDAVGNAQVVPGIPVLFQIPIADASADTDLVTTYAIRVLDFWFRNTGIAASAALDTVQLKNGATAITDAIAKTATVEKVVRASTMAAAQLDVAAGGTLRITAAKNLNVAGVAYILAVRT